MPAINEVVCPRCGAPLAVRFDHIGWRVTCLTCENSFDFEEVVRERRPEDREQGDRAESIA